MNHSSESRTEPALSPVSAGIANAAMQWAQNDPDPATAAQLREMLRLSATDSAAAAELADSFAGNLQFGTAGLRAAMGPGPNRMNRTVVRRAAAGVAAHLLRLAVTDEDSNGARRREEAGHADRAEGSLGFVVAGGSDQESLAAKYRPRAVIGFDARHNSADFATETAAIFTAAGIETFLLPSPLPTPVLAYAVRALGCEAGIMVTASHNPAKDNGYKVYLGNRAVAAQARGVQIVAPHDAGIAAHIAGVSATAQAGDTSNISMASSGWGVPDDSLLQGYINAVSALADVDSFPERDLRIVHTSMHGVGNDTALAVLNKAGFTDVHTVTKQAAPDPDFPTVPFPNPEEPGALDLAFALAHQVGADIVLANDPDADRAAVGAVDPGTGEWHKFHGDEVGALLGAHLVNRGGRAERMEGARGSTIPVFANSIVSSRLLARIAVAAGYRHQETLTGFKWISRVPGLTFGYEEALGYCVAPEVVRDKDGMSAGLLIAEMAAALKAEGRTLFDVLDELALAHGLHASGQISIRVDDLDELKRMMSRLRDQPPVAFAGSNVVLTTDLSLGTPQLPATDGLLYVTRNDSRVIVRPSGTEPKLKCYLEVIVPVSEMGRIDEARSEASSALSAVGADIKAALGV